MFDYLAGVPDCATCVGCLATRCMAASPGQAVWAESLDCLLVAPWLDYVAAAPLMRHLAPTHRFVSSLRSLVAFPSCLPDDSFCVATNCAAAAGDIDGGGVAGASAGSGAGVAGASSGYVAGGSVSVAGGSASSDGGCAADAAFPGAGAGAAK